jgi:hypothetical protein
MILPSTYQTSISLPSLCNSNISVRNRSVVCAWKYHTDILELQRDAWKRNRSDVYAWKYHTEILELQRDGREIEVLYVLGSIRQKY